MTPLAVFCRTLLRTSAIFIGTTVVFLHPPLDWTPSRSVTAQKSPSEAAIDGLISAMKDPDANVRRVTVTALARLGNPRAMPVLLEALDDRDPVVRHRAAMAIHSLTGMDRVHRRGR